MFKKFLKNIKESYIRNANIRKINKQKVNVRPLSKETIKLMNKRAREFRKAEREGRVVYDDIHHIVYIKKEGEEE